MYSRLASHRGFRLSILAVSIGLIVGLYFLLVALFPPKIDARALIIAARTGPSIEVDTDHVMLEVQDTFLFIVSQGYARSHLLDIVSTLQGRAS